MMGKSTIRKISVTMLRAEENNLPNQRYAGETAETTEDNRMKSSN